MGSKIWLSSPHMGTAERKFVDEAFETNWISPMGANIDGFEQDLAALTGIPNVVALNSATAAIHLALLVLGVGKDDIVLGQSLTFSASANPVVYQGAIPVFIDSEEDSWNMDPVMLEKAIKHYIGIGKKPKAIIPVHLYGMPAKMDDIMALSAQYDIPVIEDAAEAVGSTYNNRACGSLGTFGVLSFNGNKIITTSGGGALLSNDEAFIKKALFLATQAKDPAPHYQHTHIGYNYRLSNVLAGIGRGQMQILDERIKQRRANYLFYKTSLKDHPGIVFQPEAANVVSNRWLTCFRVDPEKTNGVTREDIRLHLATDNIESRPLWKPMHIQPIFSDAPYFGTDVSEKLFEHGLCVPSGSNLSPDEIARVVNRITEALSS